MKHTKEHAHFPNSIFGLYRYSILRVFENRVLRRIYGLETEEVTGGWRKLHNEELHNLYASPNIMRGSNRGG
jgi:hypothetical protein